MMAMDYEEARQRAWFLTDKMAYELNLTPEQYDRAYEINLDYLMSIRTASDCSGYYWEYRNADLRCILFDWQYNLFRTIDYFLRPIRWVRAGWYYPVCDHYRYGYYYFDRPAIYVSYGGRGWRRRSHNDPSPYHGMHFARTGGMRDHYHHNTRPGSFQPPWQGQHGRPGRPGGDHHKPDGNHHQPGGGVNKPGNNRPGNDGSVNRPGNGRPGTGGGVNKPGNNRPGNDGSVNRPGNGRPGTGGNVNKPGNNRPGGGQSSGSTRPGNNQPNKGGTASPGRTGRSDRYMSSGSVSQGRSGTSRSGQKVQPSRSSSRSGSTVSRPSRTF